MQMNRSPLYYCATLDGLFCLNSRSGGRGADSRGFRPKEVRFNEQVTKETTYLLKNVLGGTIILEIAFLEPYFSAKVDIKIFFTIYNTCVKWIYIL